MLATAMVTAAARFVSRAAAVAAMVAAAAGSPLMLWQAHRWRCGPPQRCHRHRAQVSLLAPPFTRSVTGGARICASGTLPLAAHLMGSGLGRHLGLPKVRGCRQGSNLGPFRPIPAAAAVA